MNRILFFVVVVLAGCSSADDLPGYKKKSGDLGAGLNYGWEVTRDGKQFTSMVVVSRAAFKRSL